MKPIRSSLLLLAVAILLPLSGCGGGSDSDPQQVLDTALSRQSLFGSPVGPAEVEVASLGFEDAVLDSRLLAIDAATNRTILDALAGSTGDGGAAAGEGSGGGTVAGLAALIGDLSAEGSVELDGLEVERVTGSIDVEGLIDRIRPLAEDPGAEGSGEIPGVGQLDQLQETLVAADFELFAAKDGGSLERFDLILSLDDRGNALPPSRIRFSLTDTPSGGGTQ